MFGINLLNKMLFYDSAQNQDFSIACFTMEKDFLRGRTEFLGLPLVAFEEIQGLYPPAHYDMVVLFTGYRRMRDRGEKYLLAKSKGYKCRNYISPYADVTPDLVMGENNIILGQTHVGFGGIMGDNNLIWPHVFLAHEFTLGNNVEITGGCKIGGEGEIKDTCYIGLGATIINHTKIAEENLIGAGSVVIRNTEPFSKNVGNPSRVIGYHQEEGMKIEHKR